MGIDDLLGLTFPEDEIDRDGDELLWPSSTGPMRVSDMGDGHLENTIRMLTRRLRDIDNSLKIELAQLACEPLGLPEKIKGLAEQAMKIMFCEKWIPVLQLEQADRLSRVSLGESRRKLLEGSAHDE